MTRDEALAVIFDMAAHGAEDMAYYTEDYARGDEEDETAVGYREALERYNEAVEVLS